MIEKSKKKRILKKRRIKIHSKKIRRTKEMNLETIVEYVPEYRGSYKRIRNESQTSQDIKKILFKYRYMIDQTLKYFKNVLRLDGFNYKVTKLHLKLLKYINIDLLRFYVKTSGWNALVFLVIKTILTCIKKYDPDRGDTLTRYVISFFGRRFNHGLTSYYNKNKMLYRGLSSLEGLYYYDNHDDSEIKNSKDEYDRYIGILKPTDEDYEIYSHRLIRYLRIMGYNIDEITNIMGYTRYKIDYTLNLMRNQI